MNGEQDGELTPRPRPRRPIMVVTRRDWLGQYDSEADVVEADTVEAADHWDESIWTARP